MASPVDAPDRLCGTYPEHSNLAPDDKRILSFGSFILSEFSDDIRSVSLGPSADTLACNRRVGGHGSWRALALGRHGHPQLQDAGIYLGRIDGDRRFFRILHPCSQAGRTLQPDPSTVGHWRALARWWVERWPAERHKASDCWKSAGDGNGGGG